MFGEGHQPGVRDRLLAVRASTVFSGLEEEALLLLAENTSNRFFRRGELLIDDSRPTESTFLVIDGLVRVTRGGAPFRMVSSGLGVGFLSVLSRDPTGIRAVAEVDTFALELPAEVLLDAYEDYYSIRKNGLIIIAKAVLRLRGNLPAHESEAIPQRGAFYKEEMTPVERILAIRDNELLQHCNLTAVIELARRGREVRPRAGEVLWSIGDPSLFSLRIDYGNVRCSNAKERSVCVGSGFTLGGLEAICDVPRSYSAVAETDVIAFRTERDDFMAVMETHHLLAMDLIAFLGSTTIAELVKNPQR